MCGTNYATYDTMWIANFYSLKEKIKIERARQKRGRVNEARKNVENKLY